MNKKKPIVLTARGEFVATLVSCTILVLSCVDWKW